MINDCGPCSEGRDEAMFSVPIISTVYKACYRTSLSLLLCAPMTPRSTGTHLFSALPTTLANICLIIYSAVFYLRHDLAPSDSIMVAVLVSDLFKAND